MEAELLEVCIKEGGDDLVRGVRVTFEPDTGAAACRGARIRLFGGRQDVVCL